VVIVFLFFFDHLANWFLFYPFTSRKDELKGLWEG